MDESTGVMRRILFFLEQKFHSIVYGGKLEGRRARSPGLYERYYHPLTATNHSGNILSTQLLKLYTPQTCFMQHSDSKVVWLSGLFIVSNAQRNNVFNPRQACVPVNHNKIHSF